MDIKTFSALAEPNRFQIVELLKNQSYSVNDFVKILKVRQPQISKHLRILNNSGLVNVKPVAQKRIYSLNPDAFIELNNWIISFERSWTSRLDNLEEYLKLSKQEG